MLGARHHLQDASDQLGLEAGGGDLLGALAVLDVAPQDRVQHVVRRQRIAVELIGPQLCRRRLVDGRLRDDRAVVVDAAGKRVHLRLPQVADRRQRAGHVAVQGGVAGGQLALVAGGQGQRAGLVRERHHQRAADARLEVLLRRVGRAAGEDRPQRVQVRRERRLDRQRVELDPERARQVLRIASAAGRRVARRQREGGDALGAQLARGDGGHHRGVDAAGDRKADAVVAGLGQVVAQADADRGFDLPVVVRGRGGAPGRVGVDHGHVLPEPGRPVDQPAAGRARHGLPVEDEPVVAPDRVGVKDRAAAGGRHPLQQRGAERRFAEVIGRCRRRQHQRRAGARLLGDRVARVGAGGIGVRLPPDVLADGQPQPLAGERHGPAGGGGLEVARLVEHVVGGQQALGLRADHGAAGKQRGDVVQRLAHTGAVGSDVACHHAEPRRQQPAQPIDGVEVGRHERPVVQQVHRRVAADRQLRADHQRGAADSRRPRGVNDAVDVAGEVADGRVDLGQGDPHDPSCSASLLPQRRLERPTHGLGNRCSIHLSYWGTCAARRRIKLHRPGTDGESRARRPALPVAAGRTPGVARRRCRRRAAAARSRPAPPPGPVP